MKKKFLNYVLLGLLSMCAVTFVACSDDDTKYDDDINRLEELIAANTQTLENLKTTITSGQWIANVESISNGVRITLGNGTTYDITNGEDGTDGNPGTAGSVVTIGDNGNWFIDGIDQGIPAKGQAGENGQDGQDGQDGANGTYYYPGTTVNVDYPYWVKVDADGTETVTEDKWLVSAEGGITAVVKDGYLTLFGVEGYPDGFTITLNIGDLRSLVFVPQLVFEGTPAIRFSALQYYALNANGITPAADAITRTNTPIAEYHMNPSSVTEDMIQSGNLSFNLKTVDVISRGALEAPTATFDKIENGILKVKVAANFPDFAAKGKLDLVALQVPLAKDGTEQDTIITSDYAALYGEEILNFAIAHTGKDRNSKYPTDRPANGQYFYLTTYNGNYSSYSAVSDADKITLKADTTLVYDSETGIDLKGMVKTAVWVPSSGYNWDNNLIYGDLTSGEGLGNDIDVEELFGFTYKFEVEEFKIGSPETDQSNFISLNGTTVTPRVYGTSGTAAIGRTPIVKVSLMDGNNVVKVAWIKIEIVEKEVTPTPPTTIDFEYKLTLSCEAVNSYGVSVEDMNVKVYNPLGLSKEDFHANYTFVPDNNSPNVGIVDETVVTGSQTTNVLEWALSANDVWNNLADVDKIVYTAKYTLNSNSSLTTPREVNIKFVVDLSTPKILREYKDLYTPFWDDSFTYFLQNVAVPKATAYSSSEDCSFNNDLYSGFATYARTSGTQTIGDLDFSKAVDYKSFKELYDALDITYTFSKENVGTKTFGGKTYNVTLNANNTELYVDGTSVLKIVDANGDPVSTAAAGASGDTQLVVSEVATSGDPDPAEIVKVLISTGEFTALIDTRVQACYGSIDQLEAGGAYATFPVKFVTPVNAETISEASFTDAVTGGSKVELMKLLKLTDWRGKDFEKESYNSQKHLYPYYGVTVDGIEINRDKDVTIAPADGIGNESIVKQENITLVDGVFTYNNDGSPISKLHKLNIPVKVTHKWGVIEINIEADLNPSK